MKDFTRNDALRNLRNWSDPASLPSDADINAELTRLNGLSKTEKKQVKVSLGTQEDTLDLDDRMDALENNTACYTIDYTIGNARFLDTGNFPSGVNERFDGLGLTLTTGTGRLSGFVVDGVYKLEYSASNSYTGTISSSGIKLAYGAIASPNVIYGRGVAVECSHPPGEVAGNVRRSYAQGLFVARNNEHLDLNFYLDPFGSSNTVKISNMLIITRLK